MTKRTVERRDLTELSDEVARSGLMSGEWEEHLEELRRRIIAALSVFFAVSLLAFLLSDRIASFLLAPVHDLGLTLYTFAPQEKFMAYLHLAVWVGIVVTLPFALLQLGLFLWPALRRNEKGYALGALGAVPVLFIAGSAAAYAFMAPVVLRFFLAFAGGDGVEPLWGLRQYLAMLAGIMLASGVLLQMPLALLTLFATGLATPKGVARFRPHIILLIFFLAALCTPPDVVSQVMVGIPLYLLFEGTLLVGRFIARRGS